MTSRSNIGQLQNINCHNKIDFEIIIVKGFCFLLKNKNHDLLELATKKVKIHVFYLEKILFSDEIEI